MTGILTRIITAEVAGEYLASVHGGHDQAACLYGVGALLGGKRAGVALVSDAGVVTRLCAQTVAESAARVVQLLLCDDGLACERATTIALNLRDGWFSWLWPDEADVLASAVDLVRRVYSRA